MHKILALAAATLLSGCASIISDSNYPVTVNSSPEGATFKVMNIDNGMTVMKGTTPTTVTLKASNGFFDGADYKMVFEKDGYLQQEYPFNSSLDGWYVGNILFGGVLGLLIIDPATGAMWKLNEFVSVSLSENLNSNRDDVSVSVTE